IWLVKVLIDTVLRGHRPGLVPVVAGAFVAIALVRGLLTLVEEEAAGRVGTRLVRDLRIRTYSRLQALSLGWYHGQRLGDLLTRLSGDIAAVESLAVSGLTAVSAYGVTIVVFLALLVVLDPVLVLVALAILPVVVVITLLDARMGRRVQGEVRRAASHLTSTAEEGLSAVALVKAFARQGHERIRYGGAADASARAGLRAVRLGAVFPPLSDLAAAAGTAVVVAVGAGQVLSGTLSLGSLVVFISYLASLYHPVQGLGRVVGTIQRAMVGMNRVGEIFDAPDRLAERTGDPILPEVAGAVRLSQVRFAYDKGQTVLRDVSFSVDPGEMVALVGTSGAGKTTVVSLLLSYYDADQGEVALDGRPVHRFDPDSVRRQVAAVLQEPMLFDASVADNLRYGRLGASDAELEEAARVAEAHDFVAALPDGYRTVVGPRGGRLSGGQRQRLALARALVKAAPVLVLDEATSALDPATEARVMGNLRAATAHRAVLLVAHRASTVAHADRVVVLEEGRVVEQGSPADLLAGRGAYWRLVRGQTGVMTEPG
ncbi:MAG: ABC transporter ATP-binding protein, partial [Actinomycetes bacterium]